MLSKAARTLLLIGVMLAIVSIPAFATIYNVSISNFLFSPTKTVVAFGDTVRWTVTSGVHSTESDPSSAKIWNSRTMGVGQSFDVVFTALDGTGAFPYHCGVHLWMRDTIYIDSCAAQNPGDANGDASYGVTDAVYIIDFLCSGGLPPDPLSNGDPDGDCDIDSADAAYIITDIFSGGPPPVTCTCLNPQIRGCTSDTCDGQMPGDVNRDGGIDASDAVSLLDFLCAAGVQPNPLANSDADGDCDVDSSDWVYLVDYIFSGGPAPVTCTCLNPTVTLMACMTDTCDDQTPGDFDGSGALDMADVAGIIAYACAGGPPPSNPRANGDPDGDCDTDTCDAVYLIDFIFSGGPAPVTCTCVNPRPIGCDCDSCQYVLTGDPNNNEIVNIADVVYLIQFIFASGAAPVPYAIASGDPNCNCLVNIADVVMLVQYIFAGGPAPCRCLDWLASCGYPLR